MICDANKLQRSDEAIDCPVLRSGIAFAALAMTIDPTDPALTLVPTCRTRGAI